MICDKLVSRHTGEYRRIICGTELLRNLACLNKNLLPRDIWNNEGATQILPRLTIVKKIIKIRKRNKGNSKLMRYFGKKLGKKRIDDICIGLKKYIKNNEIYNWKESCWKCACYILRQKFN